MLQLHLDFNMRALEAFVTLKVVEQAIIEVEVKVTTTQKVAQEAAGTSRGGSGVETSALARGLEVVKVDEDKN